MNIVFSGIIILTVIPVFLAIQWSIARHKFTRDPRFYMYLVRCKHNREEKWWTDMWELTFWNKTIKLVKKEAAKDGVGIIT